MGQMETNFPVMKFQQTFIFNLVTQFFLLNSLLK